MYSRLRKYKKGLLIVIVFVLCYFIYNGMQIYNFSSNYSEEKSDVAIVLGAGASNGKVSPIFKERLNHSIYLFNNKKVKLIVLTGGYTKGQKQSDSEIAEEYLIAKGLPEEAIIIEKLSRYTIENLSEAKQIMDSLKLKTALIVSDPLHMKRSVELAKKLEINCKPSPTKTTMYKSFFPKTESLLYETFYYSLGKIVRKN